MAKRVLIYTNHFFPENFKVNEIASMLSEEGMEVKVITGIPNYPEGKIFSGYGYFSRTRGKIGEVEVTRLWLIPRGNGSNFRIILNYLSYFLSCLFYTMYIAIFKKKYDVVFVHHTSPILIAISPILYKWIRQPKMILWDLDMWPDTLVALGVIKSKRLVTALEVLISWIYKQYDYILLGSKSFVARAQKRVNFSSVEYFPNWAENIFSEGNNKETDFKKGFPEGFKIMYAGNIGEAQDFGNVFKAMDLLKNEDVNWLIVGDGRGLKKLKEKVANSGMDNKVTFYGNNPLETMPYFFSNADVMFFSLQNKEIFSKTVPAKLQAYMASGKPVVGMISGEGAEIIKDANCGFSVASGDYTAFANAIIAMKNEKAHLKEWGLNGKTYYDRNFSAGSRKEQLKDIVFS